MRLPPVLLVVLAAVGAFYLGVAGYVLGSYAFARAHHPRRGLLPTMREALREGMLAALVQPLLPFYYLAGRRLAAGRGRPVVCVHGYGQNRVDFLWLSSVLGRRGFGPFYGFNYWPLGRPRAAARQLLRFVERVRAETGAADVDLLCHSMGGLVALEALGAGEPAFRRIVTIGTPHRGVAWQGPILGLSAGLLRRGTRLVREGHPLAVSVLSIYSTHDNVIGTPDTGSLTAVGGRDVVVPGLGHLALLFDRRVADAIATFLAEEG